MDLVKKIIVSILTIVGILLAGVIICAGVLVVFPDTRIFGISYINTTTKEPEMTVVKDINTSLLNSEYTIEILAGNYNVELTQNTQGAEFINAELLNNVVGFTKELDSNKKAKLTYDYSSANNKLTLTVTEPNGWFIKRDTVLKVSLPEKLLQKRINIVSTTNSGITTFGTSTTPLKVHDVTVSCLSANGGVKLENAQISGDLNIKNILGRIDVKNDISGTVTIDSTIGTYTFGKINDLVVVAGEDGQTNNPAITLEECRNVNWLSNSGSLVVKGYVLGEFKAITKSANFTIEKTVGEVLIEGETSNVSINQVGNFEENATTKYNSFNWQTTSQDKYQTRVVTIYNKDNSNISINRSYFKLSLNTAKGKINVKNAMREVDAETKSGSISVDFVDTDNYTTETNLDKFIYNNFISYLDGKTEENTTHKKIDSLKIRTVEGAVNVSNIRNSIEIIAESSPITLSYKNVVNDSFIQTSSKAVTIKAPINNFKVTTKMDKKSSATLEVKFGKLIVKSYNDELVDSTRMKKYEDGDYKCLDVTVNNADDSTANVITVINTTGKISVTSY